MLVSVVLVAAPVRAQSEAYGHAAALAALGPRTPGSTAHSIAVGLLLSRLREMRLTGIVPQRFPGEPGWTNVTGVLPGKLEEEILLTAHYDTVPKSPGAVDDASGCAVVLTAINHLRDLPLRHSVRVVLFDGEESGQEGSKHFLRTRRLRTQGARSSDILAVVNLDMVGQTGARRGVLHVLPGGDTSTPKAPPTWLVRAALDASRKSRWPLVMGDSLFPVLGQLSERVTRASFRADAGTFAAAGIPALLFSDASLSSLSRSYHTPKDDLSQLDAARLDDWADFLVVLTRRIDTLTESRLAPRAGEREYLVIANRLWSRPVLQGITAGLAMLLLLILWSRQRRQRSADHWLGTAFALSAALAGLWAPIGATVLLTPALLLGLAAPRPGGRGLPGLVVGIAPLSMLGGFQVAAIAEHWVSGWIVDVVGVTLNLVALLCYLGWRCRWVRPAWMKPTATINDRATAPLASRGRP
jgi:hypothetical protein